MNLSRLIKLDFLNQAFSGFQISKRKLILQNSLDTQTCLEKLINISNLVATIPFLYQFKLTGLPIYDYLRGFRPNQLRKYYHELQEIGQIEFGICLRKHKCCMKSIL